jgi:cell division control protein 45
MVLYSFLNRDGISSVYDTVKESSSGRQACSVMILVAYEVDALAATRILTSVLKTDSIPYTIRGVANFTQLQQSVDEILKSDIKTIFMVNCGAVLLL